MFAHVPSFGRNPRGSPDFLAYTVPKACQRRVLGTWIPSCLAVSRSALSPKAALASGCSLTPGLQVTFCRVACMARAASVFGLWELGFLLLCDTCACFWGSYYPGFSWFGFRVWYVFRFGFLSAFSWPFPKLALFAGGCGFCLLRACSGWGLVRAAVSLVGMGAAACARVWVRTQLPLSWSGSRVARVGRGSFSCAAVLALVVSCVALAGFPLTPACRLAFPWLRCVAVLCGAGSPSPVLAACPV